MKISDILTIDNVIISKDIVSKKQLLEMMCQKISEKTRLDMQSIYDTIMERESLGSTGFGGGTALPHARIVGLEYIQCVFVRLDKGVEFDAVDNKTVDLCFMLISPENCGADHLSALAQISKLLRDENCCSKIRDASSSREIFDILTF